MTIVAVVIVSFLLGIAAAVILVSIATTVAVSTSLGW